MNYFKHPTALVDPQAKIGNNTRLWAFTNIQANVVIGEHCNICDGCFIEKGVVIGNHVTLKNNIAVFEGVTIEDDVFCGVNTSFINDRFPRSHRENPWVLETTLIKRGATIGTNTTILCGLTVGEYAFVGAGSVVTKNVLPYEIVVGNPAHVRGYACRCGKKLDEQFQCVCGLKYHFFGQELKAS